METKEDKKGEKSISARLTDSDREHLIDKSLTAKRIAKMKKPKITTRQIDPIKVLKKEREIAMNFAIRAQKKFNTLIKSIILFGSQAKKTATSGSDIDIIIIIDDASINWDLELVAWYREELGKLLYTSKYKKELHINTIKLTTWWQDLMHGDPVVVNILRYGQVLLDFGGFFNPLKVLLLTGKIKPTPEAIYTALQRSPAHLARSKMALLSSIDGVYWTMIDAAQAALITLGKLPPSPEHIAGLLSKNFVEQKMLKPVYAEWMDDIYNLHRNILHGNIGEIKGAEIDEWQDKAEKFLLKMTEVIDILIDQKRKS